MRGKVERFEFPSLGAHIFLPHESLGGDTHSPFRALNGSIRRATRRSPPETLPAPQITNLRMPDCGPKHGVPGGRRAVARGVARRETFRQKIVQRFDAGYLIKAQDHSAGRNSAVARLLAFLSFLRNLNVLRANAVVEWDRAHLQAIKGDSVSDAAHRLPCQIWIDRQFPWELAAKQNVLTPTLATELRSLFGDVWALPKVFNAADSVAESNCLRGALVDACASVILNTKPIVRQAGVLKRGAGLDHGTILLTIDDVPNPSAGIDSSAVAAAYAVWTARSIAAFRRAVEDVRQNGRSVDGEDHSDDVIYILERYIRFAAGAPSLFSGSNLFKLEESLWLAKP